MDRSDEKVGGGTLIVVDERYEAQEGYKPHTPNMQALGAITATGGLRVPVVCVYLARGPTRWRTGNCRLLDEVTGSVGEILILGDFSTLAIDWVCETSRSLLLGINSCSSRTTWDVSTRCPSD